MAGWEKPYPKGAVPITAASGNVAASAAAATLAARAGMRTYLCGFECTASGATGALVVLVTVTGTMSGTLTYIFVFPAGVAAQATPLQVIFDPPIPSSGLNTAIVVNLPSGGSGNTNAAAVAHGYYV